MCGDAPDVRKIIPKKPKIFEDLQKTGDDALDSVQETLDDAVEATKTNVQSGAESVQTELTNAAEEAGINTDQDFMPKIEINMPTLSNQKLNLDQDFSKISLTGLAESAQKQGGKFQQELINIGSAGQAALTAAGAAGQQNLIDIGRMTQEQGIRAGSAMQTNAIELASLTGIKNEAVENEIAKITKGTENEISKITKGVEGSIATETKGLESTIATETAGFEGSLNSNVGGMEANMAANLGGIENLQEDTTEFLTNAGAAFQLLIDQFRPGGGGSGGSSGGGPAETPELPEIGDEEVFPEIEESTTKADKLTEEERQRRIRRLMLNRYGREDTILTGAKDPMNRRRYASAL